MVAGCCGKELEEYKFGDMHNGDESSWRALFLHQGHSAQPLYLQDRRCGWQNFDERVTTICSTCARKLGFIW